MTGTANEHGTSLAPFIFLLNGKPIVRPYQVNPTRTTASTAGNVLTVTAETAGRPIVMKLTYEVSSDGQTLTLTSVTKTLLESEFIDNMRYFVWSLGKDCEFCHVKGHFDSDDPAVRCFTCHELHEHPPVRPTFADEPAAPEVL